MYKLDKYKIKINIDLENGIYVFDNESATGKTRLCKLIKKYQAYGEKIASYTYEDKLLGIPLESILIPNKYKVILLDRYDMYEGDCKDGILACAKDTIILVDCKDKFTVTNKFNWCYIEMEADKIEVTE